MGDEPADASKLLMRAVEAAARRDVREYLVNLISSHALDGVVRNLETKWPDVEGSEIELAVSNASDALYSKVSGGALVRVPAGFIWRAAHNHLLNRHKAGLAVREPIDELWDYPDPGQGSPADRSRREAMRQQAIQIARSVLPSLGQTTVVQVMSVIIDCVEQGDLYIDNRFVAETLGLSQDTVRKAKHRGFKRLAREARKRGVRFDEELAEITSESDDT